MPKMEDVLARERLEDRIGYRFARPGLLAESLRHSSCEDAHGDNERLEFLGDAVLELLVRHKLIAALPDADEGELTRRKIGWVRTAALAEAADSLGLSELMEVGPGLRSAAIDLPQSVRAGAMEALLGAVYLDGGLEAAGSVMVRAGISPDAERDQKVPIPSKTELQELVQARGWSAPVYSVVRREGPDHRPAYTVEVSLENNVVARGSGGSIREAESDAADKAVAVIKREERRGLPPFRGS